MFTFLEKYKGKWWSAKEMHSMPELSHISLGSVTTNLKRLRESKQILHKFFYTYSNVRRKHIKYKYKVIRK